MKKILIYGAFDRYNFGDNLMPMLLGDYIKKYHSKILDNFSLEYVAISKSNMDVYSCISPDSIRKMDNIPEGSVVIVAGGEVLCAKNSDLFLHMQESVLANKVLRLFRKLSRKAFSDISGIFYSAPWEYPFIPDKSKLSKDIKIIYNTVGGTLEGLEKENREVIGERLNKADYVSVRDKRTFDQVKDYCSPNLSPDSVLILSDLYTDSLIELNVRDSIKRSCETSSYIVFQGAPNKVGESKDILLDNLGKIYEKTKMKIVFLPIGYASGHDDNILLSELAKKAQFSNEILYKLNIWEILYVIKKSKLYIGTSLHGAIAALSYSVPHFGLNKNVKKLDNFLNTWSVTPYNRCYNINEISHIVDNVINEDRVRLEQNSRFIIEKIKFNNDKIVNEILC